jgi:putative membrane protein
MAEEPRRDASSEEQGSLPALVARSSVGGVLMGLANLVPGISGGTMLLAAGIYTRFIEAVAEVTTFKFRFRSLVILGSIGVSAVLAIALLAGPVKYLVTTHRWVMYSLFIGLTLGGVPLVWRMARPATGSLYGGGVAGFGAMALMAFAQVGGGGEGHWLLLLIAGVAGASAMILPGVSGAYLLLVLGQYEAILGAIDQLKEGLSGDFALVLEAMRVVIPVGIGVAVGVVGISNLVRWTLRRYPKATYGVLLGLLFGAVLGIWPFQQAAEHGAERVFFAPSALQVVASLALVAVGFGITRAIDHLGDGGGQGGSSG